MRGGGVRNGAGTRGDRGGATVLVVAMAGVLMFVMGGLAAAGGLVTAQRRAQAAADLAALAGASRARGPRRPDGRLRRGRPGRGSQRGRARCVHTRRSSDPGHRLGGRSGRPVDEK